MYQLLPWWIMGAPMVLALLDLMRTPKVQWRGGSNGRSHPEAKEP
jgi:hypothetical protein